MNLPVCLVILDGWGFSSDRVGNAIGLAKTPTMDRLWKDAPHALLGASGKDVGLPEGQTGNSEAGHINIGAGRIVEQDALFISHGIRDGSFFENPAFHHAIASVQQHKSTLHLVGLLSDGQSGHMLPEHLYALIQLAARQNIERLTLHLFTDGRDSPPRSALGFIDDLEQVLANARVGRIGTIMGRHYAMDRAKNWDRTLKAYHALTCGSHLLARSAKEAVKQSYDRDVADEYIEPTTIIPNGSDVSLVSNGDAVILFNLRSDRARQLTKAFVQPDFEKRNHLHQQRQCVVGDFDFIAMTDFGPDLPNMETAYLSRDVENSFPKTISHLRQLYIAEAEKYAHMTYFLNGGYKDPVGGEDRTMIPSLDVASFVNAPHMSAESICNTAIDALSSKTYDVVGLNFANADMVAHTGNVQATIDAVSFLDTQLKRLVEEIDKQHGVLCIVGDHGNAEIMVHPMTGEINTHHDPSPVPFILYGDAVQHLQLRERGILANVAPTLLSVMGMAIPPEMTAGSLIHTPV